KTSYLRARSIDGANPLPEYGLGYLTYNEQSYGQAKNYFQTFLRKAGGGHSFDSDASLRIADCNYALKNYSEALSGYNSLKGKNVAQDYLFFQIGLIHQLNARTSEAVTSFEQVVRMDNSTYRDNAMFQSAMSYFENANFSKAEDVFSNFIKHYADENLAPYARLKRGLCYFNQSDYSKASKDYLFVLDNHISHPAAQNALLGIQELQKQGESIDFENYLALYKEAYPDDSSLESIEFEQAKNLYFAQNYTKAISQFETLLAKNSKGAFKEDIIYYLADANQRNGSLTQANRYYEQIIAMAPSRYLNRSLDKRGRLLLETEQGREAVENYNLLANHSKNRKEEYLANEGLMKAYYQLENWDASIEAAKDIVIASWKPSNAENQATLFIGKSLASKRDYNRATDEFLKVINGTTDELAAEAKYRIAELQFSQDQHQQSLETLFQLNSNYAAYQDWVGLSFLLISDNYLKMNELLQAKATLSSLIENFPDQKIKQKAQIKLSEIDQQQIEDVEKDTLQ
ncbi:MAG: tetratricopeptide repeat protein, partial [Cytophagales bacterium]|nr:tetratricopeptide repeat protein [Cytophagales bacterium]